jgi:hypothetical protein
MADGKFYLLVEVLYRGIHIRIMHTPSVTHNVVNFVKNSAKIPGMNEDSKFNFDIHVWL